MGNKYNTVKHDKRTDGTGHSGQRAWPLRPDLRSRHKMLAGCVAAVFVSSVSFGLDRRSLGECLDKTSPCDLSPERAPNCSAMDAMANTTERWGYLEDMADWSGPVLMTPRGFFLEPLGYVSHGLFHYVATWVSARRGIRVIKKASPGPRYPAPPLDPGNEDM